MGRLHRLTKALVWLLVLGAAAWLAFAFLKGRPQDLPWTGVDLDQPIGLFTGRKLAALTGERAKCLALLDRAGVRYRALPPVRPRGPLQCGYDDAVRLAEGEGQIRYAPTDVAPSCPVVAALKLWEWQVVQPAAQRILGSPVARIDHFGSYSCRRLYGRSSGDMSEHATADAIDIAGFVLADGRRVTVVRDWNKLTEGGGERPGGEAEFLRAVRDGACDLFSTVLSPDYNAAHRDHLHLDQAERGTVGWRGCR